MQTRQPQRWSCLAAVLLPLLFGCNNQDADRLARIGRRSLAQVDDLTAPLRAKLGVGLDALRAKMPAPAVSQAAPVAPANAVAGAALDQRVLGRIQWDKTLVGADIQVDSPSNGVVRLRGTVIDVVRQRRAVDLAETTDGVDRVVNELGLQQP